MIEDDEAHLELISRAFSKKSDVFNLMVATSIESAKEMISKKLPNVIIADWMLPDGKGIELLPKDRDKQQIPLIIMTSFGNESIAVEAMKAGALDYVVKSNETFADMPRIVERALREWGHIVVRRKAEQDLIDLNKKLELLVDERTSQLEEALQELKIENIERKRTAEALLQAKEEISNSLAKEIELSNMKTRFISTISHEYRTPLTVILTSSYLVVKAFEENNRLLFDKHLGKIRYAVSHMTNMLGDVLTIGKSDAGHLKCNPVRFNLVECVKDIFEEIEVHNENKHLLVLKSSLDEIFYNTDEGLFRQIATNLITNAIKYSPENSDIEVQLLHSNSEVLFSVTDRGIGIPENEIKFIFEPFFRANNTTNTSGTGLGLSIVKRCSDAIGATLSVESKLGIGTTFTLKLGV